MKKVFSKSDKKAARALRDLKKGKRTMWQEKEAE